jgi:hypothetical protein
MADQFRIVRRSTLARLPSTTPRQMEFFTGKRIWKIAGIDERVHTEKETSNISSEISSIFAARSGATIEETSS